MPISVKPFQVGAMELEAGLSGEDQSPGWGESGSEAALGESNAFPYLDFKKGKSISFVQDNSITSNAFKDMPRQTKIHVERNFSMYNRFRGLDKFYYWMFGFENVPTSVVVIALSSPSAEPEAGDTYEDGDTNTFTFLRKESGKAGVFYVFNADSVPTGSTLTRTSGSGDSELTITANSGVLHEHVYELARDRHMLPYESDEQISGYSSGDLKNRMATLGLKMGVTDFRYPNAMCSGFTISSQASDLAMLEAEFVARDENRGDYGSAGWTFPSNLIDSDEIIAHHQMSVEVGPSESDLVKLGVTGFSFKCGIPLQVMQDTESGLYIAEPVMEGKYTLNEVGLTLSRYSSEVYQNYRDAWSDVVIRISATYGYYRVEYLFNNIVLTAAGPDDGEVAKEELTGVPGYSESNNWSSWLHGTSLIQGSPLVARIRNDNPQNMMFYK